MERAAGDHGKGTVFGVTLPETGRRTGFLDQHSKMYMGVEE